MRESKWLASRDPVAMVRYLLGKASLRKLRLLTCACCRHFRSLVEGACPPWILVAAERAATVAEQFADQLVGEFELLQASGAGSEPEIRVFRPRDPSYMLVHSIRIAVAYDTVLEEQIGQAVGYVYRNRDWLSATLPETRTVIVELVRDLFGNPFCPPVLNAAWVLQNGQSARRLAEVIYDEKDYQRLPVLADALEDAGCDNADVLNHCREPREHVRGCWVLDLLLGMW
jgi:hypothetical protein